LYHQYGSAKPDQQTLYLLNYIDDEDYRRRILTQLNRGEGRHAVARAICYGQRGEFLYENATVNQQEDQLGALLLVTNAVVLWNTLCRRSHGACLLLRQSQGKHLQRSIWQDYRR
jgi:TnpA family transposase